MNMNLVFGKGLFKPLGYIFSGFILAGVIFYLTPLKHVNFIEPNIDDIAPQEFYNAYTQNPEKYLFIDVRPTDAFNKFHAQGSINIPLHVLYDQRKNFPKRGKEIILICSGGRASGVGYHYLEHHGFLNLKRVEGGVEAWSEANLPIVFGS